MIDHISHSQLSMWHRCPRQWEFRYVKGLKLPPSGPLVLGSCYHTTLEFNFKQKKSTMHDISHADMQDTFSTAWSMKLSEETEVDWRDDHPGEIKDMGIKLVTVYRNDISPSIQPMQVEQHYTSSIAGVTFVLILDLIDATDTVIDHKTAGKSYNQADVDKDIQATAVAFVLKRPILFQNHVALKLKSPRIQIVDTYRTEEDIKWWYNMAELDVKQMKTGIAPPRPQGWHCSPKWCGYYDLCRKELTRKVFS